MKDTVKIHAQVSSVQNLQTYLDGELDPTDFETTSDHLTECVECRREINRQKVLFNAIDDFVRIPVPIPLSFAESVASATELRFIGPRVNSNDSLCRLFSYFQVDHEI
jgi:hypothetical protein